VQGDVVRQFAGLLGDAGHANLYTLALAVGVLAITLLAEQFSPRVPGALLGLILSAGAVMLFGLASRGVEMIGPVVPFTLSANASLPDLQDVIRLFPLALILSLVIMVQSAATARSFPSPAGGESDFNQDLIGVGAANVLTAVAGAFPVNASPPRTAIVAETGARSQVCGLVAAAMVALLAIFGSELLRTIPSAALAGILLFVSWRITRLGVMITIWRESRAEFSLLAATVLAIVLLPIEIGVGFGIAFSVLHGMWTATRTRLIELQNIPGTTVWWPPGENNGGTTIDGVHVVAFQAPLSFFNAEEFRTDFAGVLADASTKLIVLEAGGIAEIDFTAAQALKDAIRTCHDQGVTFAVARLESVRARGALVRFGVMDELKTEYLFRSVDDAIKTLAQPPQRIVPQ
jgi:MFS superfamily sulfate permease-like transporter